MSGLLSRLGPIAVIIGLFIISAPAVSAQDIELDYEKFTLDNGLTVVVHEDRKAPIIAVSVWYHVGSKDEPEGKTGFAHLFEHLMYNGSENHDAEYFEPFERVGATDMNGTTWFDRTNYFQNVPTPALELALWMESDRMGHLLGAVTQEKLDNQRGVVQNEKRQGDNQPYGLVQYRQLEGLFPEGHPYRHSTIGSMEDLDNASLEDVHDWFETYYGPDNAVLVLAGDIDAESARPLVEKYFADIEAGPPLHKLQKWIPDRTTDVRETMQDRVPNARIYRSWVIPQRTTRESVLFQIAGRILSSGKSSRLYKELVYDKQLAVGVNAYVNDFELTGIFNIEIDVKPGGDVAETEARLDAIMADFLENGPTREELERASTGIIADVTRGLEKVGGFSGKAVTLASGELYAGDPGFIHRQLEWLESATRSDIGKAANEWLSKGFYQITVHPFGNFAASEEGADRSALPDVPSTPDLIFPALEKDSLSNGIEVVLARRTAVPLVNVAIQFDAGYASDNGAKLGTAWLAMTMLDEGTEELTALEISDELQRLGARINSASNLDTSTVTLSALKANLGPSIELMADIVQNPLFEQKELDRLRQIQLSVIEQEKAQPTTIALRSLPPLIYGEDHAYGIPLTGSGTPESVKSIERGDLTTFHRQWLRPDNASIFVVGDTSMAEIKPILEDAFGDWKIPDSERGSKKVVEVDFPENGRIVLIDRPGSPQSMILAGHVAPPTGADNTIAIEGMNDVIGGSFTARINMNLREEKGWAYGARTFIPDARGQRPFIVFAPVQTDKTADSLKELIRELDAYPEERPTSAEEREKVVKRNVRSLPGQFETSGAVLNALTQNARFGRPLDYHAGLTEAYRSLSIDDINAAAVEVIHPDKLIWLVVGDVEQIEESVRDAGLGPVEIGTIQ